MEGVLRMSRVIDPVLLKAVLELVNSKAGGQSEVARLCGITQKQISNYVSGKTRAMNDFCRRSISTDWKAAPTRKTGATPFRASS